MFEYSQYYRQNRRRTNFNKGAMTIMGDFMPSMGDFTPSWAIPSRVWAILHVHGRFPHFYGRLSNIPPDTMNLLKNVKPLNLHQSNSPDLSYAFLLPHHPSHLVL